MIPKRLWEGGKRDNQQRKVGECRIQICSWFREIVSVPRPLIPAAVAQQPHQAERRCAHRIYCHRRGLSKGGGLLLDDPPQWGQTSLSGTGMKKCKSLVSLL